MKNLRLFILSLVLISVSVFEAAGCLQPAGELVTARPVTVEGVSAAQFMQDFTTHKSREDWMKERSRLENISRYYTFADRNDLAVALLHLGEVKEAITILEAQEKSKPGEYVTAANLGTAYELNGENAKALEWISEGVNRKRESHFGTEWLHVKILETKIALEKDPDWLKTRSVLGADFGTAQKKPASEIFARDFRGQRKNLSEIEAALVYQLHERLEFIKPPEPVMADLLGDLSRVFAVQRTPEHAQAVGDLAFKFGSVPQETQKKEPDIPAEKPSRGYLFYGMLGGVAALVAAGIYVFIRRRNYR